MGNMRKGALALLILLIAIAPSLDAQASMASYSIDELQDKSDYIVYGVCENVARPTATKYQIATLSVEKTYKGNISSTRIQVKLPDIIDDTGRTVSVEVADGSEYLAFLRKPDADIYQITFYTGLLPVKDGVFIAYKIGTPDTFFKLTNTGWEPGPPARIVVIDHVVPTNVTVNEWPWFYFNVANEGGQTLHGITFTWEGVSGEAEGTTISVPKELNLYPYSFSRSYSGSMQVEVNFQKAGTYLILINGSKVGSVIVHEAGYGSDGISFSNMTFQLSKGNIVGIDLSFTIRNSGPKPQDITFILDTNNVKMHCISNLPTGGNATFSMPAGTGPVDYQLDNPGIRTVNIWYKGNIVLTGNYNVPLPAPPPDIPEPNSYWDITLIAVFIIATILFVLLSPKVNKRVVLFVLA